jgi:asparagine synthase (glutamine-hydrolysing)
MVPAAGKSGSPVCGIAGIVSEDRTAVVDDERLSSVAGLLRHRGPDSSAVWSGSGIALVHTRLAIIDRAGGDQPMFSNDGRYGVVFNGEIYNHHDLRKDLQSKGVKLKSHCDTEVLPYLFALYGCQMAERLRGMFAFAVVDRLEGSVFLARDRFGKKPLYLAEGNGRLLFASSLDALIRLGDLDLDIDPQALYEYLVLQYVPAPLAPIRGVMKLPPGHSAVWRDGTLAVQRYWQPPKREIRSDAEREPQPRDLARLRAEIGEAVRDRLEAEVPLGIFLSGGMDSSVVVAEAAAAGVTPATFSVGFRSRAHDERAYARIVAERFGTRHTELTADDSVPDLFESFTGLYDEPFADSSALATLAVARAASNHVTVVLTGDGGDEMFGGYVRYHWYRSGLRMARRFGPLAAAIGWSARRLGAATRVARLSGAGQLLHDPWSWYRNGLFHFQPAEAAALLRPEQRAAVDRSLPVSRLDVLWRSGGGTTGDLMSVDEATYLPDDLLTKMDRATMAFGLEARSPLLDHRLAALCAGYPDEWLFDHPQGKGILRRAYRDILPTEILERPKQGFGVPIASWLRTDLRSAVEELLLRPDAVVWRWLRPDTGLPLVQGFLGGDDRGRHRVWNLMALAGWAERRFAPVSARSSSLIP